MKTRLLILFVFLVTMITGTMASKTIYIYPKGWQADMDGHKIALYYWNPIDEFVDAAPDEAHEGLWKVEIPDETTTVIACLVNQGAESSWSNYLYQTMNISLDEVSNDTYLIIISDEYQESDNNHKTYLAKCTTLDHLSDYLPPAYDEPWEWQTDFSAADGVGLHGETIVGGGRFVTANGQDAPFGTWFDNGGERGVRQNYCVLPNHLLSHSASTHQLTIGFWVSAESYTPEEYIYSPLFTAYSEKQSPNSWPMLALQSRGLAQLNIAGWTDFTPETNVTGKNNIYNLYAWEASDSRYNAVGNWLEDKQWHYYTAVFTDTNLKIYLDGEVKNEWNVDGTSEGQVISGLFTNGSELKYICLGGNQAWDWNDNDAPFCFARMVVKNTAMTAEEIMAEVEAYKPEPSGIRNTTRETMTHSRYYSIDGKRIDGVPTQKGVYIKNGRKVVVK